MIKNIKDAVERYGEDIYDIVNNSPSRSNAYFRGLELGGPVLEYSVLFGGTTIMEIMMEYHQHRECYSNNL